MIKKRTRPQPRLRELSVGVEEEEISDKREEDENKIDLEDLLELRKLRRARGGIDVAKLNKGGVKKKKKRPLEGEEEDRGGLKEGTKDVPEEDEEDDKESKARKAVRSNNFTQQTDVLDVDKHMMAYIEENMKLRHGSQDEEEMEDEGPADPYAELYRLSERYKTDKKTPAEEGSVTSSVAMLTAIPEVDLGMDVRLKNIEETEKMKRMVAEQRKERKQGSNNDEEHLTASRFYRPNYKPKSDADIMRDAKMEAMGLPQEEHSRSYNGRAQMATDEMVMERFKKRMRK